MNFPIQYTAVVLDDSALADIVEYVIHHLVAAAESPGLAAVDRSTSAYAPGYAETMTLPEDAEIRYVIALVNSQTLQRVVDGDSEPAIVLLRDALARSTPTLLAVSEATGTSLDATGWDRVTAFLRGTSARWLDIPTGDVLDAAEATRPPEDFDFHDEIYPPFWAEPWKWEAAQN